MLNKIILVDDHSLIREGIKLLIEKEGLGQVIAEAGNGLDFLDLLSEYNPDLVIMDIEMPIMGGLEATIKAKEMQPNIKILVLSMMSEKNNYYDMINAGAIGFVLKSIGKVELERAIRTVLGGENYYSNELLRQIILNINKEPEYLPRSSTVEVVELTERELEVLKYFCEGLTSSEIANKLFRSVKTIESHRSALLKKTNSKNTINLLIYAYRNKLVEI